MMDRREFALAMAGLGDRGATGGTTTQNGDASWGSTGSARVDLFFKLTRDVTANGQFVAWLDRAWEESPLDTLRLVFQARDCRGGKGDRAPFLAALAHVANTHPAWFEANAALVPEYGRWLDLVELLPRLTHPEHPALVARLMAAQLRDDAAAMARGERVSLLAKWLPSEGAKWDLATRVTDLLCAELYRRDRSDDVMRRYRTEYLSPLRAHANVIERKMCAGEWDDIDFERVPSVACKRLRKAFAARAPDAFEAWIQRVRAGKAKVNASQLMPHDIVKEFLFAHPPGAAVLEEQWKAMVEDARRLGALDATLAVCDVSGSMYGEPMQVSVGLGLLIAAAALPPFRDVLITFSAEPTFHALREGADLAERVTSMRHMPWGMNTDLDRVLDLVLERARRAELAPSAMPRRLVILSDMQFDAASPGFGLTFMDRARRKYEAHGYQVPQVVFWNLRSNSTLDFPVRAHESGVVAVSGYSPSMLSNLMGGADLTPYSVMRRAIDAPRYAAVRAPEV